MELKQVGTKTYYLEDETNIGIYKTDENKVALIDTGSEGDGERIHEVLLSQGWKPEYIIITHAHIDHMGGLDFLVRKYGVPVYMTATNIAYASHSDFETGILTGGKPCKQLLKVFDLPRPVNLRDIDSLAKKGLSWIELPGHTLSMAGVKTDDGVWFTGDAYLSRKNLEKYRYGYIYDLYEFLESIRRIKTLDGKVFVPSHGEAEETVEEICSLNENNIVEIVEFIRNLCCDYIDFDHIIQALYNKMGMRPNVLQNAILSSTTRAYITYLQDRDLIKYKFIDGIMMWKKTKKELIF